jgi:hypothetical protein
MKPQSIFPGYRYLRSLHLNAVVMRAPAVLLAILMWTLASTVIGKADPPDVPKSQPAATSKPQIEQGFKLLYNLKFAEARMQFETWQKKDPGDPLGYIAEAAGYLFEEFHHHNVLTSEFFLDDRRLLGGIKGKPDRERKIRFEAANRKGKELALKRISANSSDANALLALATVNGLQPDETDAWLSIGATNYIIGNLPAYKRFFLWFGRIHGDKTLGMEQLQIAAEKGHYMKPFAELFLALAAIREKREDLARNLLRDLAAQFPENPLFRAELARLGSPHTIPTKGGH